jgi:hypothetical protein
MTTSMRGRIGGKENSTAFYHVDFGNDEMGFMVEHRLMKKYNARFSSEFANSERLSSPGKKLYDAADAKTRANVDAEVEKIKNEFEKQRGRSNSLCG